ncbi:MULTISPECIES: hypothetical protein [Bradyrhizobium]|uniref:hypothetical protein n=1 Tax=Bradyrhizobium TaxID=374 RepID=UPI00100DC3BD|nr:hypothetical protein [Bradyrhizobium betae]
MMGLGAAPLSLGSNRSRIVPSSEQNARQVDFGSAEIVFAKETKLGQNFCYRGWLHISLGIFDPASFDDAWAAAI